MGCFLGCFGASKDDKKHHKIAHHNPNVGKQCGPVNQTVAAKQVLLEEHDNSPIFENSVRDKQDEQSSIGTRKRVTFDTNVKEYEHVTCNEAPKTLEDDEKEADFTKPRQSSCTSESGSTLSSVISFPPNHRYQHCRVSDDEDDELGCEVSDLEDDEDELDEDDDKEAYDAEYSDDEYYSGQVSEITTRSCSSVESGDKSSVTYESQRAQESLDKETKTPVEFHRGARDRAAYVNAVLNPVENTAQWKHLKAKQTSSLKQQKENLPKSKLTENGSEDNYDVAVDASLSTWLSSTPKTPPTKAMPIMSEPMSPSASMSSHGSNSVILREERPILGALTMEELNQVSATSSPRISPIRNPNEKPLRTVGKHWTQIEDSLNTTRKYKEVSTK
ncbi:hypothetical protein vseg_003850 [Gypsophila vaccaria]